MELLNLCHTMTLQVPEPEIDNEYNEFMKRKIELVPLFTLFGKNNAFTRCAVHLHKFYPVFYVELPKDKEMDLYCLAREIEKACGGAQVVHQIELVEKVPFYGYHSKKERFVRIEVYDWEKVQEIGEMFCAGKFGEPLQPYEMQFDAFQQLYSRYNLSGLEWVEFNEISFRKPTRLEKVMYNDMEKLTFLDIEGDASVHSIVIKQLNRPPELEKLRLSSTVKIWKNEMRRRSFWELPFKERYIEIEKHSEYLNGIVNLPEQIEEFKRIRALGMSSDLNTLKLLETETAHHNQERGKKAKYKQTHTTAIKEVRGMYKKKRMSLECIQSQSIQTGSHIYEYTVKPFNYNEIDEVNVRVTNQGLFTSSKAKELVAGINNASILNNVNIQNSPEYAERLIHMKKPKSPSGNAYLYTQAPPTYETVKHLQKLAKPKENKLQPDDQFSLIEVDLLFIEVFALTGDGLLPDPLTDPISFVACKYRNDYSYTEDFILETAPGSPIVHHSRYSARTVQLLSEAALLHSLISYINKADPDFLIGYEPQRLSIGYINTRAKLLNINFFQRISRYITVSPSITISYKHIGCAISNRMILKVSRIVESQLKSTNHSFFNTVYELLNKRTVHYNCSTLNNYYSQAKYLVYDYFLERIHYNNLVLNKLEIFQKKISLSRVFGLDLYNVLTRGSQFLVNSVLKDLTKSTDFLIFSATRQQLSVQMSLGKGALVLEPIKSLWTDPVIILDFQSSYSSLVIAYNLCHTTCLGPLDSEQYRRFGVTHLNRDLLSEEDNVIITPNNLVFVKNTVREGLFPVMLHELLAARILIKNSLKLCTPGTIEYYSLHAEQSYLKMHCNLTCGNIGARHGAVSCTEIAASITTLGRRTLESAVQIVNSNEKWDAKVVYGDTDSLMVTVPGRTLEAAFIIGNEIVEAVNRVNPRPVLLVLEGVGFPMLTVAKKHYALLKYANPYSSPVFEAKGIRTVRKDACRIESFVIENCLKALFYSRDITVLQKCLTEHWEHIVRGEVTLMDFVFNKPMSRGTRISTKEPTKQGLYNERVNYVVVSGPPGEGALKSSVTPEEYLSSNYTLNYEYYIVNQINNGINSVLACIGIDTGKWYTQFCKPVNIPHSQSTPLLSYYNRERCRICRIRSKCSVCESCRSNTQRLVLSVNSLLQQEETAFYSLLRSCKLCSGNIREVSCSALDCSVFSQRQVQSVQMREIASLLALF